MNSAWERLLARLRELEDLSVALRLLHWDQQVLMPPAGAAARARAIGSLESAAHRLLAAPETGALLEELRSQGSLDATQCASVRVLTRDYEQATKVPEELVRDLAEVRGHCYQAWTEARPASDFRLLQPELERLVGLKKQEADALGWEGERYDALLDQYEAGTTTADVAAMFDELVSGLRGLVEPVEKRMPEPADFLLAPYDERHQKALCNWLVEQLGFDTSAGRLDTSPHPFTMHVSAGDVRQTTRTESPGVLGAIYAAIHETGHALYDQGIPEDFVGLPVGRVPSLGMHESQSRLWENQVGRSRSFTDFLLPQLKERFPEQVGMTAPEDFYRGVNRVGRTMIRVNADELTYNLHVARRFELELALFRDELEVAELPGAWNDAMERHLGVRPQSDADGVLQDMHWSIGAFGYFPTYTIGNLYAAALHARLSLDLDGLDGEIRAGETSRVLGWLRENVHQHGYLYEAGDLMTKVVGETVTAKPLLTYLERKYSEL